jgi:hypothetical protein
VTGNMLVLIPQVAVAQVRPTAAGGTDTSKDG